MSGIDSASDVQSYTPLDKLKVYLDGVLVSTTPRHLNFEANDFLATEDAINNRIDIALTKILQNNEAWRAKKADATVQDLIKLNASNNPVLGTKIEFVEPASARIYTMRDLAGVIPVVSSNGANVDFVGPASSRQYTLRDAAGVLVPFGSNGANVSLVGPAGAQTYTLQNKTGSLAHLDDIPAAEGGSAAYPPMPSSIHVGRSEGAQVDQAGIGALAELSDPFSYWSVTPTGETDSGGGYLQFDTTATQQRAGFGTFTQQTRIDWHPKMFIKFRTPTTTSLRALFGMGAAGTFNINTNDDPLANGHGFFLQIDSGQANYRILHNDGGATEASNDSGTALTTSTMSFYFDVISATDVYWAIFKSASGDVLSPDTSPTVSGNITTDLPAAGTDLFFNFLIYNTTAANRNWYRRLIHVISDK